MNYIERLKKYVNEDKIYKEYRFLNKGKMMDYSDFDRFCIQHCKDIVDVLEENKRLNKQLDYIRSGEYYNQLRFERDILQQVVDTNGVPSEVYDYIDCTHRNTELLEENDELKKKIRKAIDKLICWGELLDADFQKEMLEILEYRAMKDDLRVGQYIKTKDGYIAKIININDFREPSLKYGVEVNYLKDIRFIGDEDIIKTSDKLIDLIERNDIITFKNDNDVYKVLSVPDEKVGSDCFYLVFDYEKEFGVEDISVAKEEMEENLCSIVTNEQFKQMKYEVNEERENE